MANRKQTPDILAEVLDKKAKPKASRPVKHKNIKPERQHTIKSDNKVKATYYISQETIADLEDTQYQLRKMAGENRSRVSKSFIVEMAVQMALEEVETKGTKSSLLKAVLTDQ
jgi:hypothetical protein